MIKLERTDGWTLKVGQDSAGFLEDILAIVWCKNHYVQWFYVSEEAFFSCPLDFVEATLKSANIGYYRHINDITT